MIPTIGFVTWNRMGMNIQNIELLLKTNEDFELYIIDNGSNDDTWEYLLTLKDDRIKEIKRFNKNNGLVYALNYTISKRRKNQPFINIDSDVSILNDKWIQNCENIIKEFPEIGILGNVRPTYFKERNVPYTEMIRNNVKFWHTSSLIGCCMYFPSDTLNKIGYFNEEIYLPDIEIYGRVKIMNKWLGYCPNNNILYKPVNCNTCQHKGICNNPIMINGTPNCFIHYNKNYKHDKIYQKNNKLLKKFLREVDNKNLYCPSIHDSESIKKYPYNIKLAESNFRFFN